MYEPTNGFACTAGPEDFTATADRDGKGRRRVTVKGTCSCRTPGYELKLKLAPPPLIPTEIHLDLIEEAPGGTVPQVITPTDVEGTFEIGDEVKRVLITNRKVTVEIKEAASL
ncbi:hypothetical protein ABZ490_04080 [Streptomyces sp. NPDC005811]|uniref:hypothetical protein n=1 Tax=Streptomyces sp. NPDC005811 TaxID=3154565 RepID=UPI0034014183